MKICIYAEALKTYTSSNPMRGWVKEYVKLRKNDSFILAFRDKPVDFKEYFKELESFPNVKTKYLKFSSKISNLLALQNLKFYNYLNINADICISPGNPDYFAGFKGKQINFLADLSSIRNEKFSSLNRYGKKIQKNILKFGVKYADKTICISNFTKSDLSELYPEYKKKYTVVYNGISDYWFDDKYINNKPALDLKNKYGEYYIWWGAISPRKNLIRLLKAYKNIISENPSFPNLLIAGKPVFPYPEFEKTVKELSQKVIRLPFQEFKTLKGYIKESNAVLFPSLYEGFGLPVIEAYALGKNVLFSDITSLPEIGKNFGIKINPSDINSILSGLIELNKNKNNFAKERQLYAKNFTYIKAAEQISDITDSVYAK